MVETTNSSPTTISGNDDFDLDRSLGFVINRTAMRLEVALDRALAPHDVTPQQWAVLNRLWEQDGLSQRELAERTFKDPPNTARILDRLEDKALIVRQTAPNDRRVTLIFLTDEGRALRPRLVPLALDILQRGTDGLGSAELDSALRVLNRIYDNLT
ncbi:MAG: MarR family winged helix-turn-helix transcriptional regulator [Candidatus Dormibacteraceae bacterium]